jgi:hypothetical protein
MELIEIKESTKQSFLRELFRISHECVNSTPSYSKGSVINDPFQSFLYSKTGRNDYDRLLDLFKRAMISSEGTYSYSAAISLLLCSNLHEMKIFDLDAVDAYIKSEKHLAHRKRLRKLDLTEIWTSNVSSDVIGCDWIESLKIDSSFECKLTKAAKSQVGIHSGHNFKNIRLHDSFGSISRVKSEESDLIIVDGIIETEGEIFSVVESYRKSGRSAYIVAAGFSPDVSIHLLKNYMMGSFRVIPLVCATQDDPIGVLVDLSYATGCEIISSVKGDTLGGSHSRCLRAIKRISASSSGTSFEVYKTSEGLQSRIMELQKAASVVDGSGSRYLSERISSLRGSIMKLHISESDNAKNPGLVSRIDSFMRALQPMTKMGVVCINGKKFPTLAAREAILAFSSFISCLRSLQIIMETT